MNTFQIYKKKINTEKINTPYTTYITKKENKLMTHQRFSHKVLQEIFVRGYACHILPVK